MSSGRSFAIAANRQPAKQGEYLRFVTEMHPWDLYKHTRDRLIAVVQPLTPDQGNRVVPITPGWTVTEVVAHVCGLNSDVADGMREGMGSDERTNHQVNSRSGRSIESLCQEWLGHAEAMKAAIDEDNFFGSRLTADLVVHLHDVQHALGLAIDPDDEATISGGRTYAARIPDRYVELADINLMIELTDDSRFEPSARSASGADLTLRATPYDFLRSVTGRRSGAEVLALDWSGDPAPLLPHFSPYGPLREVDAGF